MLEPGGTVHGFVGHSRGGCVGVLAASTLKEYKFERLLFVSPCFWKEAPSPFLSNLAGHVPGVVTALLRTGSSISFTQTITRLRASWRGRAWASARGGKRRQVCPPRSSTEKEGRQTM